MGEGLQMSAPSLPAKDFAGSHWNGSGSGEGEGGGRVGTRHCWRPALRKGASVRWSVRLLLLPNHPRGFPGCGKRRHLPALA